MAKMTSYVKKRYINIIALAAIILLNVLVMLYWGAKKSNFYWDEYHTYKNAHDCTGYGRTNEYIDDVFECNKWYTSGEMKEIYTISDAVSAQNVTSHKWIFNTLFFPYIFNVFQGIFFPNEFSKWSGIILNILLLEITLIGMYCFVRKNNNSVISLTAVILYGFSAFTIGQTMFVRGYTYSVLLMLLVIVAHYGLWKSHSIVKVIFSELLIATCALMGYRYNPFFLVQVMCIAIAFSIMSIMTKRWIIMGIYVLPGTILSTLVAIKSGYLSMLLQIKKGDYVSNISGTGGVIFENFAHMTHNDFNNRAVDYYQMYSVQLFGHSAIFIIMLVVIIVATAVGYKRKYVSLNSEFFFGTVLVLASLNYAVFGILFGLNLTRYNAWIFITSTLGLVFILAPFCESKHIGKLASILTLCFATLCGGIANVNSNIEYVYSEDAEAYNYVRDCNWPNVVIDEAFFTIQNCVAFNKDEAEIIYFRDSEEVTKCGSDEFLLWVDNFTDEDMVINVLKAKKYECSLVANTYVSNIYHVKRMG